LNPHSKRTAGTSTFFFGFESTQLARRVQPKHTLAQMEVQ